MCAKKINDATIIAVLESHLHSECIGGYVDPIMPRDGHFCVNKTVKVILRVVSMELSYKYFNYYYMHNLQQAQRGAINHTRLERFCSNAVGACVCMRAF